MLDFPHLYLIKIVFNKSFFDCEYQTQQEWYLFLSTSENKQSKYLFQR